MYEKTSIDSIILDFQRRGIKPYDILTLDLSSTFTDLEIDISGKVFHVVSSTLSRPSINVKFNDITAGILPFQLYQRIVTPFNKIFISNLSQAGTITILTAQEFHDIADVQFFFNKSVFFKDEFVYIDN